MSYNLREKVEVTPSPSPPESLNMSVHLGFPEYSPSLGYGFSVSLPHSVYETKLQLSVSFKLSAFIVQAPRTKLKKNNENKQILNATTFHAHSSSQTLIIPKNRATNMRDKK